ncbi:MAG: GspH/FimT family pseudopilin [Rudaea sp.]|uniref:GspH/FimT family pseudopilin n=1 Tax=Rudaea sp. TaxID=2136325 RepID=UPI0039E65024
MNSLPRSQGFSMVELMIVVTIIAVLTMLALPNFAEWLQNSRTRSVAESMQNGIRFAQGEAARLNRVTTFTPSATGGWTVTYVPTDNDSIPTTLQTANDPNIANVTVAPTTAISFNSLGRAGTAGSYSSATGSTAFTLATADYAVTYLVTNSHAPRRLRVYVTPGGKVRQCDPDKTFDVAAAPDGCPS